MDTVRRLPAWQQEFSCFALGCPRARETRYRKRICFVANLIGGGGVSLGGMVVAARYGEIAFDDFFAGLGILVAIMALFCASSLNPFRTAQLR